MARSPAAIAWIALGAGGAVGAAAAAALPEGAFANFRVPIYAGAELKALFAGAQAETHPGGWILVRQFRLETYQPGAKKDLIGEAPLCWIQQSNQSAHGIGQLVLRTADDRFGLSGDGFLWQAGNLIISNQVETVISRQALSGASTNTAAGERVRVSSDRFELAAETREARYLGHVSVIDTNRLVLTCGEAFVRVPGAQTGVDRIRMRNHIALELRDQQQMVQLSSHTATYMVATNGGTRLELEQEARWQRDAYSGGGDRITIDSGTETLAVTGQSWARIPSATALRNQPATAVRSNAPPTIIEIRAGSYQLNRAEAHFDGGVQVTNGATWSLQSRQMRSYFVPGSNTLDRIVAEGEVDIRYQMAQGNARATAGHAIYSLTSEEGDRIELSEGPEWKSPAYQGRGQRIVVHPQSQEFRATGDAYFRLTGESRSNAPPADPAAPPPPAASAVMGPLEIFSDTYDYQPGAAAFRGKVRVEHAEWRLECGGIDVLLSEDGKQARRLEATGKVFVEEKSRAVGASPPRGVIAGVRSGAAGGGGNSSTNYVPGKLFADQIVMELDEQSRIQRIEAAGNVVFVQGDTRATGERLEYIAATDRVRLTGGPTLVTADGKKITGASALMLDRKNNTFHAEGPYRVELSEETLGRRKLRPPR